MRDLAYKENSWGRYLTSTSGLHMHAHIPTSLCSHTCVPHTFTPVDMWTCTHTYVHHLPMYRKRECTRRKCLAFENMRHSFWTTVCGFKSIFMSRPLHPGDEISSKIIRSSNIPVACGHWTVIANRSCLPQQVSGHLSLLHQTQSISGLTSVLPSSERHPLERFFRPWQSLG